MGDPSRRRRRIGPKATVVAVLTHGVDSLIEIKGRGVAEVTHRGSGGDDLLRESDAAGRDTRGLPQDDAEGVRRAPGVEVEVAFSVMEAKIAHVDLIEGSTPAVEGGGVVRRTTRAGRIAVLAVHVRHLRGRGGVLGVAMTLPEEALAQLRALQEQMLAVGDIW